jgi:hypothetical protein
MDGHQGPPRPPREHGERERDQGHPKHQYEAGPAIIEPMSYRGGGRGMRGSRGGAPIERGSFKSRDDFNVAPRYFENREDLRTQGPPHSGPPGYFQERDRERDYYRNMQEDRMDHRQRGFETPRGGYFPGRDGPMPMRGHRGGPAWGGYSRYQGGYNGYEQQPYRKPREEGEQPKRYNGGPPMDYEPRGERRYQGDEMR